jgi:hypothetical protein
MIVAGSLLLTIALAAVAAAQVRMESNVLSFFPQDSEIARDYRFVSERLTGLYTLELDMTTPSGNEAAARRALESIAGCLSGRREVARVDHYGVFEPSLRLAGALRAVPLAPPVSGEAIGRLERASLRFRVPVDGAVHFRASALIRSMPSRELAVLVDLLRERAAALMPANVRWNITGAALLLDESQRALLSTQISSFAIAGLAVLLLIGALFRSWRALVASIVPNVLPVVAMLALMGILRIPMDPATVMIASVAMGLVVDGTIHFLTAYRLAEPRQDGTTAAADALHRFGRPILIATAVASLGFGVLYCAEFRPLAHFGLLTGATLVAAAACDVAVTPAWAAMLGLWKKL